MKAFISYSHNDSFMLESLHKHLAQLKRDGLLETWTDEQILAGNSLDNSISSSLESASLFLALLSPDYLASNYCYEKEFKTAVQMQEDGKLLIVPIILEPCDWHNTPFRKLKALPKDGKAISSWDNRNMAFLDVAQQLRKLIANEITVPEFGRSQPAVLPSSRNYKIKKDFDSIQKIDFAEETFKSVKDYTKRFLEETKLLDNIGCRLVSESDTHVEVLIVNRNKINTESTLRISTQPQQGGFNMHVNEQQINYSIGTTSNRSSQGKLFVLSADDYHLFWSESSLFGGSSDKKVMEAKEIADMIWDELLESVGIM